MRYLKKLSLVVVVGAALMAFGAGSVSAAELYEGGNTLSKGTTLHGSLESGTSLLLSTTDGKTVLDTCTGSSFQSTTNVTESPSVSAAITSLSWSGCSTTTDTLKNGSLAFSWTSGLNGTITGSGTEWTVTFKGITCRYGTGGGTNLGTVTGKSSTSDHARIDINAIINEQEPKAFDCPDTARLTAFYLITTPTGLNGGDTSASTELYSGETTLEKGTTIHSSLVPDSSSTLTTTDGKSTVDTCTGSTLEGATTGVGGVSQEVPFEIVALTWSGCSFTTDTLNTGSLSIRYTSEHTGIVTGEGTVWTVNTGVTCRYGTGSGTELGTLTGNTSTSSHASLDIDAIINEQEPKQFLCPDTTRWKANYTVTSPTGLNVQGGAEPETELYAGNTTLSKGATIDASLSAGTSARLTTTDGSTIVDTCTESTVSSATDGSEGEPLTATVSSLTWGGCVFTTDTLTSGVLSISALSGTSNGTIKSFGSLVTVNTGVTCNYGTGPSTDLGTLIGTTDTNKHAILAIDAVINEQKPSYFLCPDTTRWKANYVVTTPTGLNVRAN